MNEQANLCAHKGCKCRLGADGDETIMSEGKAYCMQRCADGRGCDHEGCNCGVFPTPEPKI